MRPADSFLTGIRTIRTPIRGPPTSGTRSVIFVMHAQVLVAAGQRVKRIQQDTGRTEMLDEAAADSNKNIAHGVGRTCGRTWLNRELQIDCRHGTRVDSRRDSMFRRIGKIPPGRLRSAARGARALGAC